MIISWAHLNDSISSSLLGSFSKDTISSNFWNDIRDPGIQCFDTICDVGLKPEINKMLVKRSFYQPRSGMVLRRVEFLLFFLLGHLAFFQFWKPVTSKTSNRFSRFGLNFFFLPFLNFSELFWTFLNYLNFFEHF